MAGRVKFLGLTLTLFLVACSSDEFASDAGSDGAVGDVSDAMSDAPVIDLELIATEQAEVGRMALDSTWVYYVVGQPLNEIHRVSKAGGPSENLGGTGGIADLAVATDTVFVNGYLGGPFALPLTGGSKVGLPGGCLLALGIAARGDDVYYTVNDCNSAPKLQLLRATRSDAGYALLGAIDAGKNASEQFGQIAIAQTDVFVAAGDGLVRTDVNLSPAVSVPALNEPYVALAIDGDALFLRSETKLVRTSRTSLTSPLTLGGGTAGAVDTVARSQIATDTQFVYFTGAGGLYRADKGGSTVGQQIVKKTAVIGVATDPSYVYFSVASEKKIYRFKK